MLDKIRQRRAERRNDMAAFPAVKKLRRRLAVIFTVLTSVILCAVLGVNLYFSLNIAESQAMSEMVSTMNTMATELSYLEEGETVDFAPLERISGVVSVAAINFEMAYVSEGLEAENPEELFVEMYYMYDEDWWVSVEGASLSTALYSAATEVMVRTYDANGGVVAVAAGEAYEGEVSEDVLVTENWNGETSSAVRADDALYYVTMAPTALLVDASDSTYNGLMVEYLANDSVYHLMVLHDDSVLQSRRLVLFAQYGALLLGGLLLLVFASWQMARLVLKPTLESLKRQAEFVAAASHELRSPLSVLRTSLAASRVAPDEAAADKYQTSAETEAERMSRLVDDLLLLAGGDAGSWKLRPEAVEADTLLIEAVEQFRPLAKKQDVRLTLDLPDEALGNVHGDADRLHQILVVLLDNALQYAPADSRIEVSARCRKGKLEIDVADHGPGIPDEDKEKVFGRFYRADKSRSDKKHFGLGLSVAQELAELHGGSLRVRDTEGGGATFRLVLPVE